MFLSLLTVPSQQKRKKKKSKKSTAAPKPPLKPISLDDPKIFEPTLQVIPGKGKVINDLRKSASTADAVELYRAWSPS